MTDSELDAFIAAASPLLGIDIAPEWHDAVRANLAVTLRMAALVSSFPLPDEADPAPVFSA